MKLRIEMRQHPKYIRSFIPLLTVMLIPVFGGDVFGQETNIEKAEPLEIVSIYADNDGESHFGHSKITFDLVDYAPPAPPISVSDIQATDGVQFISSPVGWYGHWHTAPRRQLMFCLTGELEVTVSDGETRRFGPGSPMLVEDTSGKGHISRVVGSERCFMAAISLRKLDE
jgi:hypothetical protein